MKKVLFSRKSDCIQPLRKLIERQKHRTLVAWTLDCAPKILEIFEKKYPKDERPRQALEAGKAWARGEIKMPTARKAILSAHNAATEAASHREAQAAARAVAHAAATIHAETHALGIVFYGLTAFVYAANEDKADDIVKNELKWFYERLLYWEANVDKLNTTWAPFLLRENLPNKEFLLRQKEIEKAPAHVSYTVKSRTSQPRKRAPVSQTR